MDLSLRGSQINLAERYKPKAPTVKYPSNNNQRPGSASFYLNRRSKSALSIRRPLSADERLARSLNNCIKFSDNILNEGKLTKHKRIYSSSSSSLFKFLLDEPIKRPWLLRDSPNNRSSNLNLNNKSSRSAAPNKGKPLPKKQNLNKRESSSCEDSNSSTEEDLNYQKNYLEEKNNLKKDLQKSIPGIKITSATNSNSKETMESNTGTFTYPKSYRSSISSSDVQSQSSSFLDAKLPPQKNHLASLSKPKSAPHDFWHEVKPDLPGRVSFGKSDIYEVDVSDIDNETPPEVTARSNESHFIPTSNTNTKSIQNNVQVPTSATKKAVHFGEKNGEVQSQTFEYPKCPSDNCSCSNRSSVSTLSVQDSNGNISERCSKCACNYTCNSLDYSDLSSSANLQQTMNNNSTPESITTDGDSPVIKEYKEAIKDVENLGKDSKNEPNTSEFPNNRELSSNYQEYRSKNLENQIYKTEFEYEEIRSKNSNSNDSKLIKNYDTYYINNFEDRDLNESRSDIFSSEDNTKYEREHLNNFANNRFTKRYTSEMYEEPLEPISSKGHLSKSLNNIHYNNKIGDPKGNRVITNYLKVSVTSHNTAVPKKKVNNHSSANNNNNNNSNNKTTTQHSQSAQIKRPPIVIKNRRSKSASVTNTDSSSRANMKKCGTYSCLREDSNLDEFKLDKVDSWMSLHSIPNSVRTPQSSARNRRTQNFAKYAKISNQRGGGDTLEDNNDDIFESHDSPETSDTLKSDENSQDGSTYDEIVSVIKEIEEEKKKHDGYNSMQHNNNKEYKISNSMKLQSLLSHGVNSQTESTQTSGIDSPQSSDKYKDILTYLEDVENDCDRTLLETRRSLPETNRSEIEFTVEPDVAEDVPKLADLLMLPNHQLARRIISLSLRANELANGIQLSKQHVQNIRQEKEKTIRTEKQTTTNRLREQKKHYESIVARHQAFIEQLLKDKGALCEKVTALTRRIDSQNQAWEHKLETEVNRMKETTLAGEKIRRERWVRENTKKIKELTVKGLEAEINRMQMNHQQEINELKRYHQQELLDTLDDARLKHEQNVNAVRESLAQDREMLVEKERAAIRERFEKQLEEERKSFDEQKTKLIEGFAHERDQILTEYRQKESDFNNKKQELIENKESELQKTIEEYQERLLQQEQKYQARINTIEKQFESDFIIWKREYENTCKMKEVENENSIRQHYRAERDRQIDSIVSQMDAESQKCQEEFELKLNRLKEKYDNDIQEAERLEKALREKYNDTRSRLAESEAKVQNYQSEIKQLQLELEHSKKMNDNFLCDKEKLKENARNDVLTEIANIKAERDNEIQKIYKRVQQAIEKKDSTVDLLQKENGALRERCIKLEAVIRQQRKDYCVK